MNNGLTLSCGTIWSPQLKSADNVKRSLFSCDDMVQSICPNVDQMAMI